jgi:hypothetical protein
LTDPVLLKLPPSEADRRRYRERVDRSTILGPD